MLDGSVYIYWHLDHTQASSYSALGGELCVPCVDDS